VTDALGEASLKRGTKPVLETLCIIFQHIQRKKSRNLWLQMLYAIIRILQNTIQWILLWAQTLLEESYTPLQ